MGRDVLMWMGLIILAAVVAGFYIESREQDVSKLLPITELSQIENIPATSCSYSIGAYGSGSSGNMYIYQNTMRVSVSDLEIEGFSGSMQAVLGLDGTRLMDPATIQAGNGAANAATALNTVITQAPWQCSPWWFPNSSLMQIQGAVSF